MSDDFANLARDLEREATVTPEQVRTVVQVGSANIKRDWRASASGLAHAPAYPYSITYDTVEGRDSVRGEIGPDKDKAQGSLGNLLEFGSVHNEPHNDGGNALLAEEPRFVAALEDLAGRELR